MFKGVSGFFSGLGFSGKSGFLGQTGFGGSPITPENIIYNYLFKSRQDLVDNEGGVVEALVTPQPVFNGNGIELSSTVPTEGSISASDAFYDAQVFASNFSSPPFTNGVAVSTKSVTFAAGSVAGKYAGLLSASGVGAVLTGTNGLIAEATTIPGSNTLICTILSNPTGVSDDDAFQAAFENTGDSSNLFKIDWSRASYTLAGIKTLRSNVGDGSTWIDIPLSNFYIDSEFYIDAFTNDGSSIWARLDGSDYESLGYIDKSGFLVVGYSAFKLLH